MARTLWCMCTLAIFAGAAVPSTVQAGPGWLAPVAISGAASNVHDPQVTIDQHGDVTVAWERQSGTQVVVEAATRAAGGAWAAPRIVSPAGEEIGSMRLAGDQGGNCSLVWQHDEGADSTIETSLRPAGSGAGSWQSPVRVSSVEEDAHSPAVTLDSLGHVFVAWYRTGVHGAATVQLAVRAVSGGEWRMSPPLGVGPPNVEPAGGALQLAADTSGVLRGAWEALYGGEPLIEILGADTEELASAGWVRYGPPTTSPDSSDLRLATEEGLYHRVIAAWRGTSASGAVVEASVTNGRWQQPNVLSAGGAGAAGPEPFTASRGYGVAWERTSGAGEVVEAATGELSPNGEGSIWQAPEQLSHGGLPVEHLRAAGNQEGVATVVWDRRDGSAHTIEAATRLDANDGWRPSAAISGLEAREPDVALDGSGEGVAVWVRGDAGAEVVEAAVYDDAPPVLRFPSIPLFGYTGEPLSFTVSAKDSSATAVDTLWGFGDGFGSTGQRVAHTYRRPGLYHVILTATDRRGNFTIVHRTIDISVKAASGGSGHVRRVQGSKPRSQRANTTASGNAHAVSRGHGSRTGGSHPRIRVAGSIRLKSLGAIAPSGELRSDGVRWVAYEPRVGIVDVIDTRTGKRSQRGEPRGCVGGLAAVGDGQLLYGCEDAECPAMKRTCSASWVHSETYGLARYVVEDVATGVRRTMPGTGHLPSAELGFRLGEVGSQWVEGWAQGWKRTEAFFVNWHSGLVMSQAEEPSYARRVVENLDRIHLFQSLCAPLTRPSTEPLSNDFVATTYAAPFLYAAKGPETPVELDRCGRSTPLATPGEPRQLAGRALSWSTGGTMYVTRLQPGGSDWHGAVYRVALPKSAVEFTATETMVLEKLGAQVYAAQLPWAHGRRLPSSRR